MLLARRASESARHGGQVVEQVVQTMTAIQHSTRQIVDVISVINSSAAWVYLERGALLPLIVVPAILGVMLGSRLGARLLGTTPAPVVRRLVIVVMLLAGLRALSRGLGVWA